MVPRPVQAPTALWRAHVSHGAMQGSSIFRCQPVPAVLPYLGTVPHTACGPALTAVRDSAQILFSCDQLVVGTGLRKAAKLLRLTTHHYCLQTAVHPENIWPLHLLQSHAAVRQLLLLFWALVLNLVPCRMCLSSLLLAVERR